MADDDHRAAATATIIASTLSTMPLTLLSIRRYSVVLMSESHFAV